MVSTQTPEAELGSTAIDFSLPSTTGETVTLEGARGSKGLVIVFMCNHCPYVKAVIDRLIRDACDLATLGVNTIAISANDAVNYPADSFDNMRRWAETKRFPFPYLYDESQVVAKAYGAVCTPDFFGYDADLKLRYRGRLDESKKDTAPEGARRELYEAMKEMAETGKTSIPQIPSMGCSIKWKAA
jgi:peroxiredoxin